MSRRNVTLVEGCLAIIFIPFVWAILAMCVGGVWTYNMNQWLLWAGKPQEFNWWWHGVLMGAIPPLWPFAVPAAIVTFIISFFI